MAELTRAIFARDRIVTTGLVLQEILQGVSGPRQRENIIARLSSLPILQPEWEDHLAAADLFNRCRRAGIQVESVDTLYAQLCLHHDLTMLTADRDFQSMARHCALKIWKP